MKLLDKIIRDINEIAEFGYCNFAETFKTLIEAKERIEKLEGAIDDKLFALIKEGKRDTPEYESLVKQKEHQTNALIDIMKADEKSGTYGIPYDAFAKGFRESIDSIEAALTKKPKAKKAKSEDPIVQSVISKYQERSAIGIKKYGTTLADNNLSLNGWLTHLQEELMDATLYIEKLKDDVESKCQCNCNCDS